MGFEQIHEWPVFIGRPRPLVLAQSAGGAHLSDLQSSFAILVRRADVGSAIKQQLGRLKIAPPRAVDERTGTMIAIDCFDVRPAVEQEFRYLCLILPAR